MKRIIYSLIFTFIFLLLFASSALAEGYVFTAREDFPMLLDDSSPISVVNAAHGVYTAETLEDIEYLIKSGIVDLYEEDSYYTLFDYTPCDTYYSSQTNLTQINAQSAWNEGLFGAGVKIAIIDSGLCVTASDFTLSKIHYAADCFNSDSSSALYGNDEFGHGTAVAGIIAAAHNSRGIAGLAPESDIYVFRCFNSEKQGKNSDIVNAIYSAVDDYGCDIINMSFGGTDSEVFKEAVDYAYEQGVLLVAAAGNDGSYGNTVYYPASYDNVISVGSSSADGHRASHSQRNDYVNIMAPGEDIYSVSLSGYSANRGTSFSTPQVTAAAALIKCLYPDLSNDIVTKLLYTSADVMKDRYSGHGQLNISSLIRLSRLYNHASASPDSLFYFNGGGTVYYSFSPSPGYRGIFSLRSDSAVVSASSEPVGKCSESDFENSKLFIWKMDSLTPLNAEINEILYAEE